MTLQVHQETKISKIETASRDFDFAVSAVAIAPFWIDETITFY